ncbi:MAG: LCP family protein [Actinomycetia bacterium]|nr:LCP family protein [Actinomycetes bacterium]
MLEEFPDVADEGRKSPRRRMSAGRKVFIGLLVLLMTGVLAVGGFAAYLSYLVTSNVTAEPGLVPESMPPPTREDGTVYEIPQRGTGKNILMLGVDSRPGDSGRADVIVLAHITEARDKVYLTHFPRDLYVAIPGHGRNKINASYAWGGPALTAETLQNLLGVRIDRVAKTNMQGFENMTNAVGGVRVYAEEASGRGGIQQGWNDLDGARALEFVRERYSLSQGDISRGHRQQAFIKALMVKALSRDVLTNPVRLTTFVDAATENLVVDEGFDMGEMRDLAFSLSGLRSEDVVFITAPFTGFGTAPDGGWIEIVDEGGMERLGHAIRTDTMEEYAGGRVIP